MVHIDVLKGDITKVNVDAIVNAANESLLGGGGVDGAIHRAAGKGLLAECRTIGGCPTGEARLTHGYNLRARYVIHTVGPIWRGGLSNEERLLFSAYTNSLTLARDNGFKSIAFPNISTGIYGYPKAEAAKVAIAAIRSFMLNNSLPEKVVLVCFDDENYTLYKGLVFSD